MLVFPQICKFDETSVKIVRDIFNVNWQANSKNLYRNERDQEEARGSGRRRDTERLLLQDVMININP